jgi:hypothetical protein
MSTWPATLPAPRLPGYGLQTGDPTARTDMDSGPARVRRRFTAAPDRLTLSFVFTEAQMVIFRAFWLSDFQQGAAWVFIPIKDGSVAGLVSRECRPTSGQFKSGLLRDTVWAVEFDVEVRSA